MKYVKKREKEGKFFLQFIIYRFYYPKLNIFFFYNTHTRTCMVVCMHVNHWNNNVFNMEKL